MMFKRLNPTFDCCSHLFVVEESITPVPPPRSATKIVKSGPAQVILSSLLQLTNNMQFSKINWRKWHHALSCVSFVAVMWTFHVFPLQDEEAKTNSATENTNKTGGFLKPERVRDNTLTFQICIKLPIFNSLSLFFLILRDLFLYVRVSRVAECSWYSASQSRRGNNGQLCVSHFTFSSIYFLSLYSNLTLKETSK